MGFGHVALATPHGSVSAVCRGGKIASAKEVADGFGITSAEVKRFLHCGDDTTVQNADDNSADLARIRWLCLQGYANAKKNA